MEDCDFSRQVIGIKGAGDLATGVAVRLRKSGFSQIFMMERARPLAVRRTVSFCEAVHLGHVQVEGVMAEKVETVSAIETVWERGAVAIVVDEQWSAVDELHPEVLVDAIIAKKNLGTTLDDAPLVIGLGPGFTAGVDADRVVETKRGHDLGRVIADGAPAADTGIPGTIDGYASERLLRSPGDGIFLTDLEIAGPVREGETIGSVDGCMVVAGIDGILRGLLRSGTSVRHGMKVGDIDPRGCVSACFTVSDKARAVGGGVLEAILGGGAG